MIDRHQESMLTDKEDIDVNSRRHSSKQNISSDGEGFGQRRFSNKLLCQNSSEVGAPETYNFDEKQIEQFIADKVEEIMKEIRFPADEYEKEMEK